MAALAMGLGCGDSEECREPDPGAFVDCADGDPLAARCMVGMSVAIDSSLAVAEPSCTGSQPTTSAGGDVCASAERNGTPVLQAAAGHYVLAYRSSSIASGFDYQLELRMDGPAVGVARLCRSEYSDLDDYEARCEADWTCSDAGTVTLSSNPDEVDPATVQGVAVAEMETGDTITMAF
tara:strand:+ start:3243 stop:3779 length:537 start_codon:yes stop_codon:yes gene_type:complete